jgi:hypothetical protein
MVCVGPEETGAAKGVVSELRPELHWTVRDPGGIPEGEVEIAFAYAAASVTLLVGIVLSVWATLVLGAFLAVLCGFAWMTK